MRHVLAAALLAAAASRAAGAESAAGQILSAAGSPRGLCLHLGCGRPDSASLTADLAAGGDLLVHGLALDETPAARAREAIAARGLAGRASVEKLPVRPLPYLADLANLVAIEDFGPLAAAGLTMDEVLRVVAPGGTVCRMTDGRWQCTVKPRPPEMDEWTHPTCGPDGNRVSRDRVVGFPVGLRWQGGMPMNFTAWAAVRGWVVGGRRCYILSSTQWENLGRRQEPQEYLEARDAFNGLPLWRVNCETINTAKDLNSHNQAPLATDGASVYVNCRDRLVALDGATGRLRQTYPTDAPPVRVGLSGGVLVASCWKSRTVSGLWGEWNLAGTEGAVHAFDAASGRPRWSIPKPARYLLIAGGRVFLVFPPGTLDKDEVLAAVDLATGQERWRIPCAACGAPSGMDILCAGPDLVVVALPQAKRTVVLSAADGGKRWEAPEYAGAFLVDGTVWLGKAIRDAATGEPRGALPIGIRPPRAAAPCTPITLVEGRLMADTRGCTYYDLSESGGPAAKSTYRAARGGCVQGATPANGLFYTAQNRCKCAPNQVPGFLAFGPCGPAPSAADFSAARPTEAPGPAPAPADAEPADEDWPLYRHDARRTAASPCRLPEKLVPLWTTAVAADARHWLSEEWRTTFSEALTPPVAAGGLVVVARPDAGEVVALDAAGGKVKWRAALPARVDSAPTLYRGLCLIGCHDGWVYALRAADGGLAWRSRAAPAERRMVAFGQVESVWPVTGSVLAAEGTVYALAGRSSDTDGGLALCRFDAATGQHVSAEAWGTGHNDLLALAADGKPTKAKLVDTSWRSYGNRTRTGNPGLSVQGEDMTFASSGTQVACTRAGPRPKGKGQPAAWTFAPPAGQSVCGMVRCADGLMVGGGGASEGAEKPAGAAWLIGPADGQVISEHRLPAPPVADGLAVARGRLYASLQDGTVVCLGAK